jgi:hypothetical protein
MVSSGAREGGIIVEGVSEEWREPYVRVLKTLLNVENK